MVEKKDVTVITAISDIDTVASVSSIVAGKLDRVTLIGTITKVSLISTISQVKHLFTALQTSMKIQTATITFNKNMNHVMAHIIITPASGTPSYKWRLRKVGGPILYDKTVAVQGRFGLTSVPIPLVGTITAELVDAPAGTYNWYLAYE